MINGAYELLVCISRQFCGSILRKGRLNFKNESGCGGRTSVMFIQTIVRGDQGKHNSTPGINSSQEYPVLGRDRQLYSQIECYACPRYGNFSNQCPDKQQKAINLVIIGVMLIQNGYVI